VTDPREPLDPDIPHDWDAELAALLDEDAEIPRRGRHVLRIVGAVVLVGLLVLLVLVPGGWLAHRIADQSGSGDLPRDAHPTSATLAEHPSGAKVTDADWRVQEGSAVLIGPGAPVCAGAITTIGGHRYVTSARHCLDDVLEAKVVSPEPGLVQEVTGRLGHGMAVYDPVTHRQIAALDRIAVGTGDDDVLVATTRAETARFQDKPARALEGAPAVGDEVASFASSGADGFRPHRLTGVYLGRYSFEAEGGHRYAVDLVGYRQAASAVLVGRGHSGSSPTGAGGSAFGPLLFSLNQGTKPADRAAALREMSRATGLDLASEELVGVDEVLHVTSADYRRFDALLRP
jgi:hypothetical protein